MTHYGPPSDGVTTPPRDERSTESEQVDPRRIDYSDPRCICRNSGMGRRTHCLLHGEKALRDYLATESDHGLPMAWSLLPDAELRAMAQGCTESTCLYHGHVNDELRRRERQRGLTTPPGEHRPLPSEVVDELVERMTARPPTGDPTPFVVTPPDNTCRACGQDIPTTPTCGAMAHTLSGNRTPPGNGTDK